MIAYRDQLAQALRALTVELPGSYAWYGVVSRAPRSASATPDAVCDHLVAGLAHELYRSFYTRGRPEPRDPARIGPARSDPDFVRALSAANQGTGGWEPGWRIEAAQDDVVRLSGRGLRVRAPAADCRPGRGPLRVGAPVRLRRPKETASAGFYAALGDAARSRRADDVETRVYFNVTPAGAPALVSVCTRLLNGAAIPFELKVADHPAGYDRCDPAVLYLDEGGVERLAGLVPAIFSACRSHLRPRAPAFTRPLVPGVAVGEHRPALGGSFGELPLPSRRRGRRRRPAPGNDRPAGAPGCRGGAVRGSRTRPRPPVPGPAGHGASCFLRTLRCRTRVIRIAEAVADAAVWFRGRCNWVGAPTARPGAPALAALGPDLYGGTSGIALWLAECAARFGDERLRATALGAIRTALEHAGRRRRRSGRALPGAGGRRLRRGAGRGAPGRRGHPTAGRRAVGVAVPRVAAPGGRGRDERLCRSDHRSARRAAGCGRPVVARCGDRARRCADRAAARGGCRVVLEWDRGIGRCTISADMRTAPRASAMPSRSCSARPASPGSATPPGRVRVRAFVARPRVRHVAGSARRRAGRAARRADPGVRLLVQRVGGHRALTAPGRGAAARRGAPRRSGDRACGVRTRRGRAFDRAHHDLSLCHGACGTAEALLAAAAGNEERRAGLASAVSRWGAELDAGAGRARGAPAVSPGLLLGPAGMGLLCLRLARSARPERPARPFRTG